MQVYAGMNENMDYNIGRLFEYLKEIDEYDNTIIIFFSDNGPDAFDIGTPEYFFPKNYKVWINQTYDNSLENLGNAYSFVSYGTGWSQVSATPFFGFKGTLWEGGIRTPLIIKTPSLNEGKLTDALVVAKDIAPTILDYAMINYEYSYDNLIYPITGKSIRSLIDENSNYVHNENEYLGFEIFGNEVLYLGDYKLQKNSFILRNGTYLFNIKDDPSELIDISNEEPDKLNEMIYLLEQYENEVGWVSTEPPIDELRFDMNYPR